MAENAGKKKNGTVVLVLVLVLVIAALVVAVFVLLNKQNSSSTDSGSSVSDSAEPTKRNVVVNEENVEDILNEMAEEARVSAGSYEVTMNTTWNFADGQSASYDAYVENSVANTNDVYFDVVRADNEETVYASPLLPIGSHIENITLDKELAAGSYDCVVVYNLVDEEQNVLSQLQVGLTINVEE